MMKLLKLRQIIKFASCPAALDLSLCRLSINNTIDAFCLSAHDSNSHRILAHFYRQLSVYNQWNRLYFSIVVRKLFCLRGFQMQSASVQPKSKELKQKRLIFKRPLCSRLAFNSHSLHLYFYMSEYKLFIKDDLLSRVRRRPTYRFCSANFRVSFNTARLSRQNMFGVFLDLDWL